MMYWQIIKSLACDREKDFKIGICPSSSCIITAIHHERKPFQSSAHLPEGSISCLNLLDGCFWNSGYGMFLVEIA